jgi:hypothetical protein
MGMHEPDIDYRLVNIDTGYVSNPYTESELTDIAQAFDTTAFGNYLYILVRIGPSMTLQGSVQEALRPA